MELQVTYRAQEGMAERLLEELEPLAAEVRAKDGPICYQLSPMEGGVLLREVWDSRERQQWHLRQPHMARLGDIKARLVEETLVEEQ